ncbi:MAG: hypothetical protein WAO20_05245 [Acidobacteriota bacterium]
MIKRVLVVSTLCSALIAHLGCSSPQRAPFFKVKAFETALWLVGSRSYVSFDGGLTWESREFGFDCDGGLHPITMSRRISICGPETLFQTFDRELKVSEDGGRTWQTIPFAGESRRPPGDVFFRDRQKGIVVNFDGIAYTTEDGGESWIREGRHQIWDVVYTDDAAWVLEGKELWRWDSAGTWSLMCELRSTKTITLCQNALLIGGFQGYLGRISIESGELQEDQPPVTVRAGIRSRIESIRCVGGGLAILTPFDVLVLTKGTSEWRSVAPEEMEDAWSMDALGDRLYVVGGDWADWLRGSLGYRFAFVCQSRGTAGCEPLNPRDDKQ